MRYLITFSYDGSCFNGYQRQKGLKTVQGTIENVLNEINKEPIDMQASGRTDKGVHALNQKAHFDLNKKIKPYNLKTLLNRKLDGEIYIKDVKEVSNDFHARYNVKEKTYKYIINTLEYNPIEKNYVYQYNKKLDIKKMKKALSLLKGTHDFRAFCSNQKERENCVRTITKVKVIKNKGKIEIIITGNGFLRKMVRNVVGALLDISEGKKDITYISELINIKEKIYNIKPAPAEGLYLFEVRY